MVSQLSDQATLVVAPGQVSSNLENEEVILHIGTGIYYGLDPVGTRIWTLLQQPCKVFALYAAIYDEFDVTLARVQEDVKQFLLHMLQAQLIEVIPASDEG